MRFGFRKANEGVLFHAQYRKCTQARPSVSQAQQAEPFCQEYGFFHPQGAAWGERLAAARQIVGQVLSIQNQTSPQGDPLLCLRPALERENARRLADLEASIRDEIQKVVSQAVALEGNMA